jgi:pyruvate,water dikinase
MNAKIVPLRDAVDIQEVGGKAAALGRLLRATLLAPDGFVIPVAAFKEHVSRAFAKLAPDAAPQDRAKAIMRTPISKHLEEEVQAGWDTYIKSKAAVRSSATVEDSATASFAGQFHTELHVGDAKAALKALRRCWASLYSAHAVAYSAAHTEKDSSASMAVIVQEMIDPVYAGVAFTREPATGAKDVAVVEWVAGIGESLVSGKALDGRAWLDRKGTVLRADYLRGEDVPQPVVWRQLAENLKQVVKVFGPGQDVEWAWSDTKLFLLQARPDTQSSVRVKSAEGPPPWLLPGRPPGGWTKDQLTFFDLWDEYNPPVVYPLDFFLYSAAIWQASIDMLDFGEGVPQIERVVVLHESVPVMLDPAARVTPPKRKFLRGKCSPDFEPAMERIPDQVHDLESRVGNLSKLPDDQLLKLLDESAALYRNIQVTRLLKGMDLWIDGEEQAKKTLRRILRPLNVDVDDSIEILESGVDHETSRMNRALRELAAVAASEGKTKNWSRQLANFLQRFGHFESNGTLLCESRETIEAQIDRMIEAGADSNTEDDPQARATALLQELLLRLPEGKKRQALEQAVTDLRHWVALRENSKMRPELPLPLLKRLQVEAGRRLTKRRVLRKPEHVKLLTPSELHNAFQGKSIDKELLDRRARLIEWKSRHPSWLPHGFLGESCSADDPILFGVSGSPGVADGPARVVRGPDQFGEVRKGDVVVARSTNPVWTQLFTRIAAIVVENGSRLSHAAVVAREVGIPAVVGIPGVLAAVKDGERLRVDGTAGKVIRLEHREG